MKAARRGVSPARAETRDKYDDALIHVDEKHGGELSKRRGGEGSYDLPGARVGGERRGRGQVFVRSGQSRGAFGTGGKNCKEGTRSSKSSSHSAAKVDFVNHRRAAVNGRERFPLHTSRMWLRGRAGKRGRTSGVGDDRDQGISSRFVGLLGWRARSGPWSLEGAPPRVCGLRERVCRNVPRRGAEVHLAVDVDANGGGLDARGFALSLTLERRGSASGLHVDETERGRRGRGDTRATSRPQPRRANKRSPRKKMRSRSRHRARPRPHVAMSLLRPLPKCERISGFALMVSGVARSVRARCRTGSG